MRLKIDPEIVRFVVAITAGLQGLSAVLTGTDVMGPKALVVVVAVTAFLQGWAAAYAQGVQTEPAHGMLTEESSRTMATRSEEHTSELQSLRHLVCRLLLEKKKKA